MRYLVSTCYNTTTEARPGTGVIKSIKTNNKYNYDKWWCDWFESNNDCRGLTNHYSMLLKPLKMMRSRTWSLSREISRIRIVAVSILDAIKVINLYVNVLIIDTFAPPFYIFVSVSTWYRRWNCQQYLWQSEYLHLHSMNCRCTVDNLLPP